MIDKENKKTLGKKTHEGKILIYCGGNILLLRRWCQASCVATYSSSGVGVTRLVLRHTPPPPALVSRDLCCDVLLLRHWCHATGVATYSFSHVKSKRLLPLVGNPRHETQSICAWR